MQVGSGVILIIDEEYERLVIESHDERIWVIVFRIENLINACRSNWCSEKSPKYLQKTLISDFTNNDNIHEGKLNYLGLLTDSPLKISVGASLEKCYMTV
ncbi:MAG: hypothetical protein FWC68_04675 [Oscillospiraceae bacterium]|nr:hypothetical protein [Oscillospiraceae bacterium]